jgi:3-isopropylmalate dehydrogenase
LSGALLLAHVGEDDAAARVDKAVEHHLATRGDEKLSTAQVGDRIAASL